MGNMYFEFDMEEIPECDCKMCKLKTKIQHLSVCLFVAQIVFPFLWIVTIGALLYVFWCYKSPIEVKDFAEHEQNRKYIGTLLYYDIVGGIIYGLMLGIFIMTMYNMVVADVNA